jgi:hypothetical protein
VAEGQEADLLHVSRTGIDGILFPQLTRQAIAGFAISTTTVGG